ncbi:hypothetical protein HDU98_001039 [Podochytrium sp. JEL0797]|nr:hypothetical protein HDU98_001039 [Podochytrium sp. JEL0797]
MSGFELTPSTIAFAALTGAAAYLTAKTIFNSTGTSSKNGFRKAGYNWPLIGHTFQVFVPDESVHLRLTDNGTRKAINISILGLDCLSLLDPEFVKLVLVKGFGTFATSLWFPRWATITGPRAVNVVDNPAEHKRVRNLLSQSITKDVLTSCYPQLRDSAHHLIAQMSTCPETRAFDSSMPFTFTAILFFMFGSRPEDVHLMKAQESNFHKYTTGTMDFIFPEWMNGPYAQALRAKDDIVATLLEIISSRRRALGASDPEGASQDGLSKLLFAKGEALTDLEIADNLVVMVVAGYDSTAATISSCLHFLTHDMSEAEKAMLVDEIREADVSNHAVLMGLPVLDAFVKEVMRMKPPVTGIIRQLNQDTLVDGKVVPKGSYVSVALGVMAHNPRVFEDPSRFQLSRFLNVEFEEGVKQAGSLFPFGAGPRLCLGMALAKLEIKVFVYELLSAYSIVKGKEVSVQGAGAVLFMNPSVKVVPLKEE